MKKYFILSVIGVFLFAGVSYAQVVEETWKVKIAEKETDRPGLKAKDAVYDKEKGELNFKVNKATGKAWRLVHDGVKVITVVEGADDTTTTTCYEIVECVDEKAVDNQITALGLTPLPVDEKEK